MSGNDTLEVYSCPFCGEVSFHIVVGGGLSCIACGSFLSAFWIADNGINGSSTDTEEKRYAN